MFLKYSAALTWTPPSKSSFDSYDETISFKEVVGTGKSQITFDEVPLEKACKYAAEDADITLRLHQVLKPRLINDSMMRFYERFERPLVPILSQMESKGIAVDATVLKSLSQEFAARIDKFESQIYNLASRKFSIGSPKQLGEILFDELGYEGGKRTKSGAYATGADVLDALSAEGHELPRLVLEWRQLSKLKSTYTDALLGHINSQTGRVHTSYSMVGANTGLIIIPRL